MNIDGIDELGALDQAIREVSLKLKVQDQTVDRLLGEAFVSHPTARRAAIKFLDHGNVAGMISALSHDGWKRSWHFGATRADYFQFWNRAAVQQALANLIPTLQERALLEGRYQDLVATHKRELARRMDRPPVPQRDHGRSRQHGRGMVRTRH